MALNSMVILQTIPDPKDGTEWLLQYVEGTTRHERRFTTFECVAHFVERNTYTK